MHLVGYQKWIDDMLAQVENHEHVYTIEMKKNQKNWFLLAVTPADVIQQVYWTSALRSAHLFMSEQTVEEFKADYITPRKVSIIRLPALEMLLSHM